MDEETWTTIDPNRPQELPANSPPASGDDVWRTISVPATSTPINKYRQAAIEDRNKLISGGALPAPGSFGEAFQGYGRRIGQGAGLGWTDELMAAGETPIQMFRRGTLDPREGYRYAKAGQDLSLEKAREATPGIPGVVADLAGGLATGAGVLGPATRTAGAGVNYLKGIAGGAGLGAVGGAGEAPTVSDIPGNAVLGGVLGAGLGAALPAVPYLVRPLTGRMRAPDEVATQFLAEKARMAGKTPEQLTQDIADATAAGQGAYTIADALGKEGARALTSVAKLSGEQRNMITDAITGQLPIRARNMPYRLEEQLGEGLGVQGTAQAASRDLRQQARTAAGPVFERAMQQPTTSDLLDRLIADPLAAPGLRHGVERQRIRAAAANRPFDPLDHVLDAQGNMVGVPNTRTLQTLKTGLDRMVQNETEAITGNLSAYGEDIKAFRNSLVREMGRVNPTYAEANRIYAGPMQVRDAVETGRDMATRGRFRDTVPAFNAAPATEQQGQRIGAVDKILEQAQTGRLPAYITRGNQKGANELEAMSLYQGPNRPGAPDQLRQRLDREQTMRETEHAALGGSPTAENFADMGTTPGGLPGAMGMVTAAAHGNGVGFLRNAAETASHFLRGQTEAQRAAIARALLTNTPDAAQAMAARIAAYNARRQQGLRVYGNP